MTSLNRRQLVVLTLAASLAGVTRSLAQAAPKKVTVALDWTPNTNHIGLYVARDKGFYSDAGLAVEIVPYSDTAAGTLVANRIADFGIIGSIGLLTQRAAGADLRGVYAVVQSETGRVVFDASRTAIQRPKDLDGLKYGGFGSAWENALLGTIIRHDGGKGNFETVTLGTSAYEALANGSVDFTLEVATWEGVQAELAGEKQRTFRYADYGVPDEQTTLLGSSQAYLAANPGPAKAFVTATQRGYAFAVDHPDEAAKILVAANADFLTNPPLISASLKSLVDGNYLRSAGGAVGTIDPGKMAALGSYLFTSGILKDADGAALKQAPDLAAAFSNEFFA
ncbi:MAG: myristoyl transferase [Hyphomicrobiales bacterium]|nr:myristoyl transferase [Hyphomicrobiales bacterium]